VDRSGTLYIADSYNGRIRKVSGGIITTVAGNGTWGYNGDNVNAALPPSYMILKASRWITPGVLYIETLITIESARYPGGSL